MSRANVARIVRSCFTGFTIVTAAAGAAPQAFEVGSQQKDQLPRGKEADGIIGDFVFRNNKIEAVISGNLPLRRANMSTFYGLDGITPGCLYDLTLRGANSDQVIVRALSTQSRTNPAAYPDADGRFTFQLPEGDYELEFADLGRTSVNRTVTVQAAEPTAVDAAMDLAALVAFDIRDAAGKSIPCKAQFLGIEGTASPYLGPHIERLGLAEEMQTVSGVELTGSGPHLNSFPFIPDPFSQDHGAPVWNPDSHQRPVPPSANRGRHFARRQHAQFKQREVDRESSVHGLD